MSDAFSDLWSSTGASKPADPPRKLGTLASASPEPQAAPRRPQNDVFSLLAAAGSSSNTASRSVTPTGTPTLGSNAAKPIQKAASTGTNLGRNDAFSDLLSGFSSTQSANSTNLTMAQRAALAERERRERAQQQSANTPPPPADAWAGLDALGARSISMHTTHTSATSHDPLEDLGLGSFSGSTGVSSVPSKAAAPPEDDWGLGDFVTQPTPAPEPKPSQKATPASQFDLLEIDDFVAPSTSRQSSSPAPPPKSDMLGDFDFGDREDGLLGGHSSDEDDILGDLSKPVEKLAARQSARNTPSPQPLQSGQRSRTASPPPHILGQIVEMGFSIQQARIALAATDTGLDVQAALEMLLSNGAASSSPGPERQSEGRSRRQNEAGHERYYSSDEEHAIPPRQPQRPAARSPPQAQRFARDRPARDGVLPSAETQRNLQEQADKLLAQASEIGLTMFSRANALWKESKERVQKAYEERAAAAAAAAGSSRQAGADPGRRGGRPKWMQDAPEDVVVPDVPRDNGFRDDDENGAAPPRRTQAKQAASRTQEQPPAESTSSRLKVGNLFSDDPPAVYVSPFRRKATSRTQTADPSPATTPTPAQRPSPSPAPARPPSPIPIVQRRTVSATPAAIAESNRQKALGTEKFKLGQYAEAESFYTAAILALPERHLLLVPLYNNRALTRIKTGDHTGAIEDCTTVINLIGPSYHPAREAKVTRPEDGAGVDLADGLVKAWWRRAEAFEGKEKWDAAKQDWEAIAAADFAGKARNEAVRGLSRCRRMLNTDMETGVSNAPSAPPASKASVKPVAKPKPAAPRVSTPSGEALNRVREANQAAEAEDQQKHELKDVVDAKLAAWKAGKENNIRALIASLDTVLWPELGWQKVGIHELVSPSQVKIRYTKAIAKVHPDKLNVNNTTLEQRMVANGVFGTLNEAWNAFKP
ncbi:hypothetical protein BN946_scf185015.g161 [Trametes cinnabarina]|uniref:UBA domain-containing protein n=1 Tax=Pycnoporus cinnabarinus TaxID=5643 RepID=A0A060SH76_PYCCI|nr:hypothetical protein BN946_scf185015.g161 [Trametes cinnabarina]